MDNPNFKGFTVVANGDDPEFMAGYGIERMIEHWISKYNAEFIFTKADGTGMEIVPASSYSGIPPIILRKTIEAVRDKLNEGQSAVVISNRGSSRKPICELKGIRTECPRKCQEK